MLERRRHPRSLSPGFTLPAVIIVAVAMLILAIGLLSIIGIERKTARSFADAKRADLAARAGLEDFNALLRAETANDDYLVIASQSPNVENNSTKEAPAQLFVVRGEGGGNTVNYRYLPLFSSKELPQSNGKVKSPEIEEVDEDDADFTSIKALPWQDAPRVEWIPVQDSKGETVARYAYWVEDMQGKLDAKTVGDPDKLVRNEWPFPASGINAKPTDEDELKLDQVAIRVLDPKAVENTDNDLTAKIVDGRPLMLSPGSIAAAAGFKAPLKRDTRTGLLEDEVAAALERSVSPVSEPYEERATVPYAPGISADAAGKPKLNLNALLAKSRPSAVNEFASWIETGLPEFEDRKGGFPDDYLRTLAANAFDYADTDSDPTQSFGGNDSKDNYRGLDGYPLVSEFATTFRWADVRRENGRLYAVFSVGTFPELWNMTDQTVSGMAQLSFETDLTFQVGPIPSISFEDLVTDNTVAAPVAVEEEGYKWQPAFQVTLRPNEIKVYACRTEFKIDVGSASDFIAGPLTLAVNGAPISADGGSGYRFRWNGKMVDQSRGNMWRRSASIDFPREPRQFSTANVPAHSLSTQPAAFGPFDNNMGDPRMSFYHKMQQAANQYPENYSPNRRTVRWGTIYSSDGATKPKVYGRVLPSEWPDGGHDFPYGVRPPPGTALTNPDDPSYTSGVPNPEKERAPMRLSNRGRFYSATELGRTYDPVMWRPTYAKQDGSLISGDTNSLRDGSLPGGQASWPDATSPSSATESNGGGNTLRIGRAEHQRFAVKTKPGLHAAHLLDLFHAGKGSSDDLGEREGEMVDMRGAVNLNTATADTIRALAAGMLEQDPRLCEVPSKNHQTTNQMAAPTQNLEIGAPKQTKIADRVAQAVLYSRPFASAADIASAHDPAEKPVFGNREMYEQGTKIQWTDSAAEEVFARIYEASTLRSRNFRVWVVGQAVYTPPEGSGKPVEVLSETKKVFTVFADPGERKDDESINTDTYRPRVTHENDF
ncbi:hypothetical protein [Luteolibacter sp. Populi]|uniref:type IV pilus modification PilV family protein n=1 Tax=Luteolibacter sp. Populi TaxID=3230487 RepID=UPI003466F3C6